MCFLFIMQPYVLGMLKTENQIFSNAFPTRLCLCIFNFSCRAKKKLKNNI